MMKNIVKNKQQEDRTNKPLLSALHGEAIARTPFWLMRQAGRYLPEYKELRAKAGSFLDLAYNPDFAIEVTMQPLRRYGMDAAILFSDILVVPHALGQNLEFVTGEGPKLNPIRDLDSLSKLKFNDEVLEPVYEAVAGIRQQMKAENFHETALIGFAGAPWTVATYMVEGGSSRDFSNTKKWAYSDPDGFAKLIDLITNTTIHYLGRQIEAGAEVLQIFDSWAGALDEDQFKRWVIEPTVKIVRELNEKYPDIPIIGFPKGAGVLYQNYANETGVAALGLDSGVPMDFAKTLQKALPVQGNLDPVCLLTGGDALKQSAEKIINALSDGPFIFNLGHGIIKETPPEHVEQLAEIIRDYGQQL